MRYLLLITALLLLPVIALAAPQTAEQEIGRQQLEPVLNDFLADGSEQLPHIEFLFSSVDWPQPFKVPAGVLDFQVIPAKPGLIGSRRITLLTRVDDQIVDNRSIRVELEAIAEILVAADNLRRGDIISPDKVSTVEQDISRLKEPIFSGDDVYGKQLKRSLRLGKPLLRRQVEFPPLIERGDRVVIQAQRGGLLLTAAGEARQDGIADDTIRVMNLGSRNEVLCRVVEPGLVTVEF